MSYVGKSKDKLVIRNDRQSDEEFERFLADAFRVMDKYVEPGSSFYIWFASREDVPVETACGDVGWEIRQTLIWNKNALVLSRQDYQWKHEPCLYGWKEGAAHTWESDRKQTTVLDFDRPLANEEHPTMKPVALFEYLIRNSSKPGDVVLDTFAGSGTTVIACAKSGRKGYVMELDPKYADVIVKRFIKTTGSAEDVRLIRNGEEIPRECYQDIFRE